MIGRLAVAPGEYVDDVEVDLVTRRRDTGELAPVGARETHPGNNLAALGDQLVHLGRHVREGLPNHVDYLGVHLTDEQAVELSDALQAVMAGHGRLPSPTEPMFED